MKSAIKTVVKQMINGDVDVSSCWPDQMAYAVTWAGIDLKELISSEELEAYSDKLRVYFRGRPIPLQRANNDLGYLEKLMK